MNPFRAFVVTQGYVLRGRLHFSRERVGKTISLPDGTTATIFREVHVAAGPGQAARPGAQFHVRFHLAGMAPALNKVFSWLPVPFFVGLPGFRSKLWLLDEATGDFHGLYQWETPVAAERYAHSFALRFMTARSVPGSLSYTITPLVADPA